MNKSFKNVAQGLILGISLTLLTGYAGISILPIARGGTGSATKNFLDLTTGQTAAGAKILSTSLQIGTGAPTALPITRIWTTTASIDPPSMSTDSSGKYPFTVTGVTTSDVLISWGSTTADVGNAFPVSAHVSGADQVSLVYHSRVTVDVGAATYTFTFIRS